MTVEGLFGDGLLRFRNYLLLLAQLNWDAKLQGAQDPSDVVPQTLAGRVNGITGLADNGAMMLAVLYTGIMVDAYGWKPVFFGVGMLPFLAMASLFLVLRKIEPAKF